MKCATHHLGFDPKCRTCQIVRTPNSMNYTMERIVPLATAAVLEGVPNGDMRGLDAEALVRIVLGVVAREIGA